jgi:hypothetical protein
MAELANQQALVELLEPLLDLLAEKIANRLQTAAPPQPGLPERRLLTLDELVAQLPAGKKPETWKRWLYQRTRNDQIPGQVKLGNRLFFDAEVTLPWLKSGCTPASLDAGSEESLHVPAMAKDRP